MGQRVSTRRDRLLKEKRSKEREMLAMTDSFSGPRPTGAGQGRVSRLLPQC